MYYKSSITMIANASKQGRVVVMTSSPSHRDLFHVITMRFRDRELSYRARSHKFYSFSRSGIHFT